MNTTTENNDTTTQITKQKRRTSEERRNDLVQREIRLAEKSQIRAELLKQKAMFAAAKAELSLKKAEEIKNRKSPGRPLTVKKTLPPEIINLISKKFMIFSKEVKEEFNIELGEFTPHVTQRGVLSLHVTGKVSDRKTLIANRDKFSAKRESEHYKNSHRNFGLKGNMLNKDVKLQGDKSMYRLVGMRGKGHYLVLENKSNGEAYMMRPDDFKKQLIS